MNIFVMVPNAIETMTYERDECLPSSNKSVSFKNNGIMEISINLVNSVLKFSYDDS